MGDFESIRRHYGHERWIVAGHWWGADLALAYDEFKAKIGTEIPVTAQPVSDPVVVHWRGGQEEPRPTAPVDPGAPSGDESRRGARPTSGSEWMNRYPTDFEQAGSHPAFRFQRVLLAACIFLMPFALALYGHHSP